MDMIYGVYMVMRAEVVTLGDRKAFECDLLGDNNHKISLQIYIEHGSKEDLKRYEAIKPYAVKGTLLHIEFVCRWYNDGLQLCIATFKKATAFSCSFPYEPITANAYFSSNRGYWARYETCGEWVQFPGVIGLGGEACIPMGLQQTSGRPKLLSYLAAKESEYALTWVKRSQNLKELVKKLLCF